jgi:hypothetical protein
MADPCTDTQARYEENVGFFKESWTTDTFSILAAVIHHMPERL